MRTAEWINILAFSFLVMLTWRRSLPWRRQAKAIAIGGAAVAATLLAGQVLPRMLPPLPASVLRDWLPYPLLLLFYWQAGQFFTRVDLKVQRWLLRADQRFVIPVLEWLGNCRCGRWTLAYLEGAYLFCYPLLPMGVTAIYVMRRGSEADHFWTVVLAATDFCYGMLPFIQTEPPRRVRKDGPVRLGRIRRFNLWILHHASIHANTLPSAHVASSTACALVLLHLSLPVGLAFLVLAISIALGAVAGRYHYAADAVLGAMVALVVHAIAANVIFPR